MRIFVSASDGVLPNAFGKQLFTRKIQKAYSACSMVGVVDRVRFQESKRPKFEF